MLNNNCGKSEKIPPVRNWTLFKTSLCRSCWASCCHNIEVQVSVSDLIRLGLIGKSDAASSLHAAANRLVKVGILLKFKRESLVFELGQKKNKDCIFLDENRRCTVYSTRPEICRQFPKIGPKPGFCPYVEKLVEPRLAQK